jgi:hypothetical protein
LNSTHWISSGNVIVATNASASASDALGSDPRRFYRVLLLPSW